MIIHEHSYQTHLILFIYYLFHYKSVSSFVLEIAFFKDHDMFQKIKLLRSGSQCNNCKLLVSRKCNEMQLIQGKVENITKFE